MRCDRGDENDRRIIVHRNPEGRRRLRRLELNRFQRLFQPVKGNPDRRGELFGRGVGIIPFGLRTNSSSFNMCRNLVRAWLIAG